MEKGISDSPVAGQIKRIDYYSKTTELYNMFDIFVLPSTNPDPLPTVVLESMACGKPVVGYRHGGVCEMVKEGKNGLLATPNQPAELSKAIQELAEDRPPYYKTVEEFKNDLYIIHDSLIENKAEALITGEFAELLEAVEVFGFYLASIDMRQDFQCS